MVIAMSATGTSLRALRANAIILLGFAGAFRRSELVALDVEDFEEAPEGLLVTIRRSKTDQEGLGRKVAIPRGEIACPVAGLRAWLEAAGITGGAIFRRVFNKRNQRVSAKLGLEATAFCRPQPAGGLRDLRGEARRQPDQDHRRDRPSQP
jgi:integrase